ncbi:TVP38/TMEM64 family protein [bacterium]|nr:TVP38/TMEM64 family protein [bacterium]MBR2387101.1 TVP38/TMEM64 family protein [bacterium]
MKKWLKIGLVVLLLAAASIGAYFIMRACGITDVNQLREIIASCGAWGWIVFIALFTLSTTLLCFVPGISMTFITVSIILFGAWKGFLISSIAVFIASSIMFVIGNTVGERAAIKLVGKDSLEKAQKLVDVKSKLLLPLMLLFPVFPDDALCLVAGMTKMKYWYFAIIALICRTIGIATICFLGSGFIDWTTLSLVDWFVLINVVVFDIVLIFKYQNKIEKFILRKKSKPEAEPVQEVAQPIKPGKKTRKENLEEKLKELDAVIHKNEQKLAHRFYKTDGQRINIENRLVAIKREREKIAKKLNVQNPNSAKVKQEIKLNDARLKLQDLISAEIEATMKKAFPEINYQIKKSLTTTSVYLIITNASGVEKTIRFSDHDSTKLGRHSLEEGISFKAIRSIVEKAIKSLNKKTVYVLLDRMKKEK